MAIVNQPTPLSNELAWNGDKNPIPDTNDGSKGLFSVEHGFPYVTQQPLAQGGIPPQRNDFNGVLNLLSKFIRYFQNGGVFAYSTDMDYSVGMIVRSGDRLYACKAENGVNTSAGVQNISNSNYWNEIILEDTLSDTLVNQLKTVLVTEGKTAANTADWNTLTESRTYKISGATFSANKHQPIGAIGTGELVVLKNGDDTIAQVYYANSATYDKAGAYHRMRIGGIWTDWVYNITNKGGSITGNFDINGKLTVDDIEVSNSLTIGGAPPLKQDAIDKLQAQIIKPEQSFFINANTGSDETGDGTQSKPYRTIAKALEFRKKDVPLLQINLYVETGNEQYYINPLDFSRINQQRLKIVAYPWVVINDTNKKPNLYVNYGKVFAEDYTGTTKYHWGNILCGSVEKVYLAGINLKINNPHTGSNYATFVCETNYLDMLTCNIDIGSYTLMKLNEEIEQKIRLKNVNFTDGNVGFIAIGNNSSPVSATDPALSTKGLNNIKLLSDTIQITGHVQISSSIYNNVKIPQGVLLNGNSGYSTIIDITYKNWN